MAKKIMRYLMRPMLLGVILILVSAAPAFAHDGPEGSEWIMADWMFITFALFAAGALVAFLSAYKAGWLSNLEDAKYYVMQIDEKDYYSG